jgi:hypothetical protein
MLWTIEHCFSTTKLWLVMIMIAEAWNAWLKIAKNHLQIYKLEKNCIVNENTCMCTSESINIEHTSQNYYNVNHGYFWPSHDLRWLSREHLYLYSLSQRTHWYNFASEWDRSWSIKRLELSNNFPQHLHL